LYLSQDRSTAQADLAYDILRAQIVNRQLDALPVVPRNVSPEPLPKDEVHSFPLPPGDAFQSLRRGSNPRVLHIPFCRRSSFRPQCPSSTQLRLVRMNHHRRILFQKEPPAFPNIFQPSVVLHDPVGESDPIPRRTACSLLPRLIRYRVVDREVVKASQRHRQHQRHSHALERPQGVSPALSSARYASLKNFTACALTFSSFSTVAVTLTQSESHVMPKWPRTCTSLPPHAHLRVPCDT
jgi:hypothetical protein